MTYTYKTRGTCSREITVELEGDVVKKVEFFGGCHGNLQGVAALVQGMTVREVRERLAGIRCGFKGTSCPDQLVCALDEAIRQPR